MGDPRFTTGSTTDLIMRLRFATTRSPCWQHGVRQRKRKSVAKVFAPRLEWRKGSMRSGCGLDWIEPREILGEAGTGSTGGTGTATLVTSPRRSGAGLISWELRPRVATSSAVRRLNYERAERIHHVAEQSSPQVASLTLTGWPKERRSPRGTSGGASGAVEGEPRGA
jgi:hypothetical protein